MEKILVALPVEERHKKRLEQAAAEAEFVYCLSGQVTREMAQDADVIIGNVKASYLKDSARLKWIQLDSAGTEAYSAPGALPPETLLTNATGAYGMAISEHMIGMLFMIQKHLDTYYLQQQKHEWRKQGQMMTVDGSTTLVIGLGDIGGTFARKMKAMGSYVIGIRRSSRPKPDYVDEQYGMDALHQVLPRADVIALSLPAYQETRGILGKRELELMKETAVVLNVGRGSAIDTDALNQALQNRKIYGAGLDVTDPEPLPPDHPLWDAPGTVITPHVSGGYALPATLEKILDLAARNLERYEQGKVLENIVDLSTGYVKR